MSALDQTDAGRAPRPDYPEIGEQLRTRRHARGLSLRELADRMGVSASLISQIERGRANPSVSTLYAMVAELDVSLDELLFNERRSSEPWPPAPDRSSARPSGIGSASRRASCGSA